MSSNIHIRIVQAGWANFTGSFGQVEFADGISVDPVNRRELDLVAALVGVETLEGEQVGVAQRLIGGATIPATVVEALAKQSDEDKATETAGLAPFVPAPVIPHYTPETLESIAESQGIKGLRAIAQPRGVKGRAIPELISEILREQTEREGVVETEKLVETTEIPETDAETPAPEKPASDAETPAPESEAA